MKHSVTWQQPFAARFPILLVAALLAPMLGAVPVQAASSGTVQVLTSRIEPGTGVGARTLVTAGTG